MRLKKIGVGDFVFLEFKTQQGRLWANMLVKESKHEYSILKCIHKTGNDIFKGKDTINNVKITLQDEVGVEVIRGFTLSRLNDLKDELFILTDMEDYNVNDITSGTNINIKENTEVTLMNNKDVIKAKIYEVGKDKVKLHFRYSSDHHVYSRGILLKIEHNGKDMILCGDMEEYDVLDDGTVEAICIIQDMDSDIKEYIEEISRQ